MKNENNTQAHKTGFLNMTVFWMCFTAWIIVVVLVILLIRNDTLSWGGTEIGWLISIPILTWGVVSITLLLFDERRRRKQSHR
jgi:nitrate/nitrite transporter NarK